MEDITPPNNPVRELVIELIEDRFEGVSFSEEIIDSIEAKIAPIVRAQAEESVMEFVADFFSPKKPTRKARKKAAPKPAPKPKAEPTSSEPTDPAPAAPNPPASPTEPTPPAM